LILAWFASFSITLKSPKIVQWLRVFIFNTNTPKKTFLSSEFFQRLISHHIVAAIFAYFHAQEKHKEKCLTSTVFAVKYLPIFASAGEQALHKLTYKSNWCAEIKRDKPNKSLRTFPRD
jgi:hypothetical protein